MSGINNEAYERDDKVKMVKVAVVLMRKKSDFTTSDPLI